jgi:hypothetical protein
MPLKRNNRNKRNRRFRYNQMQTLTKFIGIAHVFMAASLEKIRLS